MGEKLGWSTIINRGSLTITPLKKNVRSKQDNNSVKLSFQTEIIKQCISHIFYHYRMASNSLVVFALLESSETTALEASTQCPWSWTHCSYALLPQGGSKRSIDKRLEPNHRSETCWVTCFSGSQPGEVLFTGSSKRLTHTLDSHEIADDGTDFQPSVLRRRSQWWWWLQLQGCTLQCECWKV